MTGRSVMGHGSTGVRTTEVRTCFLVVRKCFSQNEIVVDTLLGRGYALRMLFVERVAPNYPFLLFCVGVDVEHLLFHRVKRCVVVA